MLGFRYIKIPPTTHILQFRNGRIVREGIGRSFWFFAPTTSLVAIPLGSTDVPFIFEEQTADYQTVSLQGQVTYRVNEPRKVAALMDFTLEPNGRGYVSDDPEELPQRVVNLVHVLARAELEKLPLRTALRASQQLVPAIRDSLAVMPEVKALGLEIVGFSLLAIRPTPETGRALEAETRENLLRVADEAIYSRRNSAVEQERAIKENELNTEIAIENKKRLIREAKMEADQAVQQMEATLRHTRLEADIRLEEERKNLVKLASENAREESDARGYAISETMKALGSADATVLHALTTSGMRPEQLIAFAFQELAGKADKIGQLNISPDLLRELMEKRK